MIDFPHKEKYDAQDLRQIVEILRGEGGCPWDREQTHATLRRNLLEETAELCEAIDREDPALMKEELGDVWLQVLFHASIEQERGSFDLDDVADAECKKLISRHPHVFGDVTVSDVGEELSLWEDLKRAEKRQTTAAEAMDAVCRTLPGLWRAEKIQKKAAHSLPETAGADDLLRELRSDLERLEERVRAGDAAAALGELLFDAVKLARLTGTDPEEALHARCEDYISAFRQAESERI
jgi:tetrapyrrole methylase family protein/MazG family protein